MNKHTLWKAYFFLLIILLVIGSVPYILTVRQSTPQMLMLPAAATLLNIWGIVGLWCYIRSQPFGYRWQWAACFFLTAAQVTFGALMFLRSIVSEAQGLELKVAIIGLTSTLLAIPLLIALWRYAFRSPRIWKH